MACSAGRGLRVSSDCLSAMETIAGPSASVSPLSSSSSILLNPPVLSNRLAPVYPEEGPEEPLLDASVWDRESSLELPWNSENSGELRVC